MISKEAEMMKSLYKASRDWENINEWLFWADRNNFILRIFDKNELSGFGVVRPVGNIDMADDYYYTDKNGDTLWVDMACSKIFNGTKMLWDIAAKTFNFDRIAFKSRDGKRKVYNFKKFSQFMKVKT